MKEEIIGFSAGHYTPLPTWLRRDEGRASQNKQVEWIQNDPNKALDWFLIG